MKYIPLIHSIRNQLDKLESMVSGVSTKNDELTTGEAAKFTHFNKRTLANYCLDGKIPARKEGRKWLIKRNVILNIKNYLDQ